VTVKDVNGKMVLT